MKLLSDAVIWIWCMAAHWVVGTFRLPDALFMRLLPFAGFYGYHVPGVTPWRWSLSSRPEGDGR